MSQKLRDFGSDVDDHEGTSGKKRPAPLRSKRYSPKRRGSWGTNSDAGRDSTCSRGYSDDPEWPSHLRNPALPNGSRLSCGRSGRWRKAVEPPIALAGEAT